MKVIVCGAGQVGTSVARYLSEENISVSIIDPSIEVLQELNNIDILTVQGSATYIKILEASGIAEADAILAVTRSDEVNMLICQIAASLYNTPLKIARIRNQEYLSSKWSSLYNRDNIPVDVIISPEREVASYIAENLSYTGGFDMFSLFDGVAQSIATLCTADSDLNGQPIKVLHLLHSNIPIKIMAIGRDRRTLVPNEETILQPNDVVHFIVKKNQLHDALALFGHEHTELSRLLIVGGGAVGFSLAKHLEHENSDLIVKLLESNKSRAETIAPRLRKAIVLHGKGLDKELLLEANIQATDTVVSVTNDENVNVLMSLFAKEFSVKRTLALVNSDMYIPLSSALKINALIHPHKITILSILKHIRSRRDLKTIHTLPDHSWELMEIQVQEDVEATGLTAEEVYKKTYGHVVAILRDDGVVFADKSIQLHKGDSVAVLIKPQHRRKLENLFASTHQFF
ncbi:MAG: Trk system potassium transporter TrkA [Alphaproteobacteria bacterium]|uniref:Trk system potassium uptake protein TrkA n=1 Tax=Candidatus Bodocaedibacter vickermanii TaxID=2741701 RepID=A0A7L9RSR1_9PROT|nr:Trk system potassium transporter TrkA [Alphaproteobacteria bacterium]QOL19579.1 Trk system potassium uptake protein TrkA [Candidatus Paracaedibacteraceae bacterium 'Lake Konstanz']